MNHLTTEELLLLADGESLGDALAHFESCSQCQTALGTLQGRLTTISSALHGAVAPEAAENNVRSWARLETELAGCLAESGPHLTREEFLLHLDDVTPMEREGHLTSCSRCESAYFELQALLSDVEHELRSLIPDEPLERRLVAHEALRNQMRSPAEVVEFPMRWSAAYAVAAAAAVFLIAGVWIGQQPDAQPTLIAQGETPASSSGVAADASPTVIPIRANEATGAERMFDSVSPEIPPLEAAEGEPQRPSAEQIVVPAAPPLEVFAVSAIPTPVPPAETGALPTAAPAPDLTAKALGFNPLFGLPTIEAPALTIAAQESRNLHDAVRVLEGRELLNRAGVWREDVRPIMKDGVLSLVGTVENAAALERFRNAVLRAAEGEPPQLEISLRSRSNAPRPTRTAFAADSPAGGLVRSALLAHYRDAARRSFRSASPSALDGEVARYVDGVFRSQDQLIEHAYALGQITTDAAPVAAAGRAQEIVATLADFHLKEAEKLEARIYDQLSEALPRRYWNYRPREDASTLVEGTPADLSNLLLADVLALEERLTVLFTGSSSILDAGSQERSSGALLHRIHSRLRLLKALTR